MREGLRRWAIALDVLVLLLAALLIRSWLVPGYRITFTPDIRISLTSWPRLALWLGVLLVMRYALVRDVPFHTRVAAWGRRVAGWEPLRAAWGPFLVSRLMVLLVAYFAVVAIGFAEPPPFQALRNPLLDLFARWDAGWYFGIASNGYPSDLNPARMNAIAFFPGLPLLMRAAGTLLHVNLWVAGIIVVVVAFLWALTYVYRLARLDLGPDESRAALLFLAFYPFAVCYSAILTEGLFLLAAAAAFYHFRRDQLWATAAFGFFAGTVRPNGFLLVAPLGLMALIALWKDRDAKRCVVRAVAVSLPLVGMLAYAAYVKSLVGHPFAFIEAQQAWGRNPSELLNIIAARRELIASQDFATYVRSFPAEVIEGVTVVLCLAAVWPITRRFGVAYGLFVVMALVPPFLSLGPVSLGRYAAPLFPIFLWLGAAVPVAQRPYWYAVFAAGQALIAALFFTWRPPY